MNIFRPGPKLAIALVWMAEIFYWLAVRLIDRHHPDDWGNNEIELFRTAMRVLASLVLCWCFMPKIVSLSQQRFQYKQPILYVVIALFFLVPVICGNEKLQGNFQLLYAATSIFVGIHEEFLWRGIILTTFLKRMSPLNAIVLSNIYFAVWHVGMVSPAAWTFAQVFLAGVVLSLVYLRSGSIILVIFLHSIYDAIAAMSPIISSPYPLKVGVLILLVATVIGLAIPPMYRQRTE